MISDDQPQSPAPPEELDCGRPLTYLRDLRTKGVSRVIGIAEMYTSHDQSDVLITYSLGSCVGLSLHDPVAGIGGLIHCMLPLSKLAPVRADANPLMFVDTGVSALLQAVFNMGATRKNLVAKLAGAAQMLDERGIFRIGERNHTMLRKILWKNDILIKSEDVGGTLTRTLFLNMATGQTFVSAEGRLRELR